MSERIYLKSMEALEDIDNYESVVSIKTSYLSNLKRYTTLLGKCTNLEELHFQRGVYMPNIPKSIFGLSKLQTLVLKDCGVNYIAPSIAKLEGLKRLVLSGLYLSEFPSAIAYLSELEELDFTNTKLKNNLEDLGDLKKLRHLNLYRTSIKSLSESIYSLPNLQELLVPKSIYNTIVKKHPDFLKQLFYLFQNSPLEKKYITSLINICRNNNYDFSFRAVLMNLLADNRNKLQQFASIKEILRATDVKTIELIRLKALEYYEHQWAKKQPNTLSKNANLAVMGNLSINKRDLRKKLKDQGIKYSSKITAQTTHLLLGQSSKSAYSETLKQKLPIITEKMVLEFINNNTEQYLVDDQESSIEFSENISNLLLSGQDENITLALELFKQGGFSKELLTDLFIAYKQSSNPTIIKETRRLLRQYASIGLIDFIKKRSVFFPQHEAESSVTRRLNKLEKNTELDVLKIAWYAYRHHKKGISFLLKKLSHNKKLNLLREMTNNNNLDLSNLRLNSIPKEVFELTELTKLNLKYNSLSSINLKLLANLIHLKELNITGNHRLWTKDKIYNNYGYLGTSNLEQKNIFCSKLLKAIPNLKIKLN